MSTTRFRACGGGFILGSLAIPVLGEVVLFGAAIAGTFYLGYLVGQEIGEYIHNVKSDIKRKPFIG